MLSLPMKTLTYQEFVSTFVTEARKQLRHATINELTDAASEAFQGFVSCEHTISNARVVAKEYAETVKGHNNYLRSLS